MMMATWVGQITEITQNWMDINNIKKKKASIVNKVIDY